MEIVVVSANCGCKGKMIEKNKIIENINEVLEVLELEADIIDTNNFDDMIKYGLMTTPAVIIDGNVKFIGRVPKVEELKVEIEKIKNI